MNNHYCDSRGAAIEVRRDSECLLGLLARIDDEGWDGPASVALLRYVRDQIARPLAIDVGLRGLAASQAEATAWQAMWIAMTKPSLRRAESPWGVLWRVARRAVLAEVVAARYATEPHRAWALCRPRGGGEPAPVPASLDALVERGWQPAADGPRGSGGLAELELVARRALVDAGWPAAEAARIVAAVVELPDPSNDPRSGALGWRLMARDVGLPPWQARRVCVALRGTGEWAGLFARVLTDGPQAAQTLPMRAALRATRVRRHRSPALAARVAEQEQGGLPQRAAG